MNKISCICITHNRVHFLTRAIEQFNNQSYRHKEMVILFENDESTKGFISSSPNKYNLLKATEIIHSSELFIEALDPDKRIADKFSNEEPVYIKTKEGKYLTADKNGETIELDTISKFSIFIFKKTGNQILLQTISGSVLFKNNSGKINHKKEISDDCFWATITLVNTQIKLLSQADLSNPYWYNLGWDLSYINSSDSAITFCELIPKSPISLGAKRNLTINIASGNYICVWDDDDLYSNERLQNQMTFLEFTKQSGCSLNSEILVDHNSGDIYISPPRSEGWENSLLCKKDEMGYYDDLPRKEDTPVLFRLWHERRLAVMDDPFLYVYNIHKNNISGNGHFQKIFKWSYKFSSDEVKKFKARYDENYF